MSNTQYDDKTNNVSLCLSHEYLKSMLRKIILKLSQKTAYVLASVSKISSASNKN